MPLVPLSALIQGAKQGFVVSFPTDTVPALAALPAQAELIYQVKQRSFDKPLILMADKAEALWDFIKGSPIEVDIWQKIADIYWAGALTLVLPASDRVPASVNPKHPESIGIRVPNCAIAQEVLAQTGPLVTTSANLSGYPALLSLKAISEAFPDVLTLETESDPSSGTPSTVAQWTGTGWKILRQGIVELQQNGLFPEIDNSQ
jgi:L-threonylcarbamoyladenylate synthase